MTQTRKIEIYTLDYCSYCNKAVAFLGEKNIDFTRYRIDDNEQEMLEMLGRRYNIQGEVTVPQIIVDGKRIGGYTDMMALYEKGEFPL